MTCISRRGRTLFRSAHRQSVVSRGLMAGALLSLAACSAKTPLEGTWSTTLKAPVEQPVFLTFKDDSTFELDFASQPGAELWGRFEVEGDEVTLVDEGRAEKREVNPTPGKYRFTLDGETVRFITIKDKNAARVSGMTRKWDRSEKKSGS